MGDLRVNMKQKVSKKLDVTLNSSLYYNDGSYSQSGVTSGNGSLVTQAIMSRPLTKWKSKITNTQQSGTQIELL